MNNFLDFITKDIEGKKAQIATLPTKTKTNKRKYNEALDSMIDKYNEYESNVYKYITVKAKNLIAKEEKIDCSNEEEKVLNLERVKFLLNPLNTYIEKIGFDTMIYQINNYYTLNFKSLNGIINGFLDKFEQAGIVLTDKDFDYTCYVHEYMTSFLEVRRSRSDDYSKVSEVFEQIYWLNPDLIKHIELNFRKLIRNNAKKLNAYVEKLQKKEMIVSGISSYTECLEKLKSAYIDLNLKRKETINDILDESKNGVIEIEHYMENSKLRKQAYASLISSSVDLEDESKMKNICSYLEKLKVNLLELGNFLEFEKLFKDFKETYEKEIKKANDKKSNKEKESKKLEQEIIKQEKELDKLNKKIYGGHTGLFKTFKSTEDVKKLKMESVMKAKDLYDLYRKYDEEYFKDIIINSLSNTLSISDVLNLYYSYDYFKKQEIQEVFKLNEYDEIIKYSEEFDLFAMNPTNIIIEGLAVFEDTNLARIICNKYRLSNINLEEEDLTEDNIKPLLNKINIILRTNKIEHSDVTLQDIWFVSKVHKYTLNKEQKAD